LDNGYPNPSVSMSIISTGDGTKVSVVVGVKSNERKKINDIRVLGAKITKKKVIDKKMVVKNGQWYSRSLIDESRLNLLKTNIFSEVKVSLSSDEILEKNILTFDVVEAKRYALDLSFGASLEEGPRARVRFLKKNVFGLGARFDSSIAVNYPLVFSRIPFLKSRAFLANDSQEHSSFDEANPLLLAEGSLGLGFLYDDILEIPFESHFRIKVRASRTLRSAYWVSLGEIEAALLLKPRSILSFEPALSYQFSKALCGALGLGARSYCVSENTKLDNGRFHILSAGGSH